MALIGAALVFLGLACAGFLAGLFVVVEATPPSGWSLEQIRAHTAQLGEEAHP